MEREEERTTGVVKKEKLRIEAERGLRTKGEGGEKERSYCTVVKNEGLRRAHVVVHAYMYLY